MLIRISSSAANRRLPSLIQPMTVAEALLAVCNVTQC